MGRLHALPHLAIKRTFIQVNLPTSAYQRAFIHGQTRTPLKILFCGADDFSIYSLRAVHAFQQRQPESISSIDVVCRPDKRVGRGLKQIQQVPIKSVASELNLNLYQIDTFTGWTPPKSIDLVVAVSFGLLVPSRILRSAQYGGLNVHPSLLPDLRGAAPIQHTLLQRRPYTGVTLQTMHPTLFDHGRILDQTPHPGIAVPESSTVAELIKTLGPMGAEMLSRGIENQSWSTDVTQYTSRNLREASYAPKITPQDRQVNWQSWTSNQAILFDRVLGRLWDTQTFERCHGPSSQPSKRVTFDGPWRKVTSSDYIDPNLSIKQAGDLTLVRFADSKALTLAISTCDGTLISPASATIEGEQRGKGVEALSHVLRAVRKSKLRN